LLTERWIAVVVSLRDDFSVTEREKPFISLPAGKFITGNREDDPPFQFDGHLIAGFNDLLHFILFAT